MSTVRDYFRKPLDERLAGYLPNIADDVPPQVSGRLVRMVGLTLEAVGCKLPIGHKCHVKTDSQGDVEAEVVGFSGDRIYLMPLTHVSGIAPGAAVVPKRGSTVVPVGSGLLGRILDAQGEPLDSHGRLKDVVYKSLQPQVINPLDRHPIDTTLDVGVKAVNAVMTVGRGQRMGLFAGSGVGKSMLLGMMCKYTEADVVVVGLIGERGREVKEFIEHILGESGLKRAVVIASPADDSSLMRLQGAATATAIAEHFRDQGKNVLLLIDSLTRYAQAQREIGLAVGEPPATKGYPPSVFARLPRLVERAGNGASGGGSITAFYTVLTEGDDVQDPIADAARAILDGHVVLSRQLAEEGHYPAIDIEASISRAMPQIVGGEHLQKAQRFKQIYAKYHQAQDLINVGAYVKGSDPDIDYAIAHMPGLNQFLRQNLDEQVTMAQSYQAMCVAMSD